MENCTASILSRVGYHLDRIYYFRLYFLIGKKFTWANTATVMQCHKRLCNFGSMKLRNKRSAPEMFKGYTLEGTRHNLRIYWV